MLNYIKVNSSFLHTTLAASIPRMVMALVVAIVIALICFNIASRLINGIRNSHFLITDAWKIRFGENPLFFCFLMLVYSVALLLIMYLGWIAVYDLFTK